MIILLVGKFGHSYFEPINEDLLKVSKALKPTNDKTRLLKFGDYYNLQSNVPSLPDNMWPEGIFYLVTPNNFRERVFLTFLVYLCARSSIFSGMSSFINKY